MAYSTYSTIGRGTPAGFTLIELLVVCVVLAAIAFIAWGGYAGVEPRARDELAKTQALTLAEALNRFHRDTGYWPGEGPFVPSEDGCGSPENGSLTNDPDDGGPPANPSYFKNWQGHPANLALLFTKPNLCKDHPLARLSEWDPDSRRGWNGPYLPLAARHWLKTEDLTDLPAFAAGPAFPHSPNLNWSSLPRDSAGYDSKRHDFNEHPRPLFFFPGPPRVVYQGVDGEYGDKNPDDPCLPNAADPEGEDDVILCL
ncbi:MAG: prepilin-type N-terminal cleavage/methylation domain-containing protein [Zoogloeaceae bacterium]|jgi:prepilin-type N-terminal cleavage/methylation domain-containing protein|nr:prepilin-type N-terminal cleavage/methylation domain-containing protein [Zoogloeaceae bacterium]